MRTRPLEGGRPSSLELDRSIGQRCRLKLCLVRARLGGPNAGTETTFGLRGREVTIERRRANRRLALRWLPHHASGVASAPGWRPLWILVTSFRGGATCWSGHARRLVPSRWLARVWRLATW